MNKKMTEQDKKLLLEDLCARLPYGVICHSNIGDGYLRVCSVDRIAFGIEYRMTLSTIEKHCFNDDEQDDAVVKPYLRPMSSMTEEEKKELSNYDNPVQRTDFFCSHHIDCRFMIEKGLALVAPEDMYKIE